MEPTLDSTLQHVLEPALHNAGLEEPKAGTPPAAPPTEELAQPQLEQSPVMPAPVTPEPVARFKKAVDPVRREANRRAAERSRGRQQEKVVALEMAIQTLSEENLRLKEEMARLEGKDTATPDTLGNVEQPPLPAATVETQPSFDAATAAAVATQAQNQHFLELLAQGANFEDTLANLNASGDGSAWAQLFSGTEVEVDGRLGQLAAVASNQAGEEPPQPAQPGDELVSPAKVVKAPPIPSATLTAEMEKALQDDIATTKAAIARAEREIARRNGQPVFGDLQDPPYEPTYGDLFHADEASLTTQSEKVQSQTSRFEAEAAVLRTVVAKMKESMESEEAKLLPLEEELRGLTVDGQRDREGVTAVLRALRGHITSLMSAPGGYLPGNLLVTPFSSPATARRKRGRPPKHASPSSSKYSFPYQHSPSGSESGTELQETPSARPPRGAVARRSRLVQELRFEPEQSESSDAAGPSHTALPGVEANVVAEASQASQDYLLSHFADDASRGAPISLDSSSFAAFLPQSPAHVHNSLDASLNGPAHGHAHLPDDHTSLQETPNVMSRFKRGPPGSCDICSRTQTSVWRKLTYEGEELRVCNACGLYHSKFHIPRPPELWGDGRTIKKRKAGPRNWEGVKRRREAQRKSSKFDDMVVDQHALEDPTQVEVHGVGVDGTVTPDAAATTLQEVGRAVENMYAVQQQQLEG